MMMIGIADPPESSSSKPSVLDAGSNVWQPCIHCSGYKHTHICHLTDMVTGYIKLKLKLTLNFAVLFSYVALLIY